MHAGPRRSPNLKVGGVSTARLLWLWLTSTMIKKDFASNKPLVRQIIHLRRRVTTIFETVDDWTKWAARQHSFLLLCKQYNFLSNSIPYYNIIPFHSFLYSKIPFHKFFYSKYLLFIRRLRYRRMLYGIKTFWTVWPLPAWNFSFHFLNINFFPAVFLWHVCGFSLFSALLVQFHCFTTKSWFSLSMNDYPYLSTNFSDSP